MNILMTPEEHSLLLEYMQLGIEGQRLVLDHGVLKEATSLQIKEMRVRNRDAQKLLDELKEMRR